MRIAVFAPEYDPTIGGGYTFIRDVLEGFLKVCDQSHHDYIVLVPKTTEVLLRQVADIPRNVKFFEMPKRSLLGRVVATLRHVFPPFGFIWRFSSSLESICNELKVETIWFIGGLYDTPDIPFFTTVWDVQHRTHPWYPEVSSNWLWDYRELFLTRHLQRASCIITGTEVGQRELERFYGIDPTRVLIAPHPTPSFALDDSESLPYSLPSHLGIEEQFIFYPAQFWPHKNHATLISALAILREEGHFVPQLVLVGSDKGNRLFLEELARSIGVEDRIHFPGFISVSELKSLYQHAIAMVYPSVSGPENLPPLEAFGLGCPVLVSDFEGAREQLGDAAYFFDPLDPKQIADAIVAIQDLKIRQGFIALGRKRAKEWNASDYVERVIERLDDFSLIRATWK